MRWICVKSANHGRALGKNGRLLISSVYYLSSSFRISEFAHLVMLIFKNVRIGSTDREEDYVIWIDVFFHLLLSRIMTEFHSPENIIHERNWLEME